MYNYCYKAKILTNENSVVLIKEFTNRYLRPEIDFAAKSLQSCPNLCDPKDSSPPGSTIPGILQARTLEWVAISFSRVDFRIYQIRLGII